jgi:hypothetical protein
VKKAWDLVAEERIILVGINIHILLYIYTYEWWKLEAFRIFWYNKRINPTC